jgi:hypothetical protein
MPREVFDMMADRRGPRSWPRITAAAGFALALTLLAGIGVMLAGGEFNYRTMQG